MDRERSRGRDRDEERSSYRSRDRDDRGSDDRSRDRDDRGSRDRRDLGRDDRGSDRGSDESRDRGRDDRDGGRPSFSYSPRSREQIDKRASMRGKEFDRLVKDGIKVWKPADGLNTIRILPATWKNPEHYGFDLYVHYGVGPDRASYLDLYKMKEQPDPISEEHAEALRDGDDKYAKEIEPKRRCGVYLIDRDNEKEGVQFWAMPWTIDADLNKLAVDKRTGETLNIDDPEDGYDVEFEKTGKDRNTKYEAVKIARRSSPLGSRKWLDWAVDNPLPDQLVYFDYDHIAKAFGGGGSHRGRDEEREESGRRDSGRDDRSRGRERDDQDSARSSGRDRERDDDRGRERDDDRDERRRVDDRDDSSSGARGRGRGDEGSSRNRDDDRGGSSRRNRDQPAHSWESIHDMTIEELESFCESEDALQDVNPGKADGLEDLADWICEELKLKKAPAESTTRRRIVDDSGEENEAAARLRRMREERNR